MISETLNIVENINKYSEQLENLLKENPVKYSKWPTTNKGTLGKSAGIYHFFENNNGIVTSLYVGKAGFGSSNWSLLKRLKQHFQESQENALIGKIKKTSDQTPEEIKSSLCEREVYLQWLVLYSNDSTILTDIEPDLVWSECFCKSILMPRYTNA